MMAVANPKTTKTTGNHPITCELRANMPIAMNAKPKIAVDAAV